MTELLKKMSREQRNKELSGQLVSFVSLTALLDYVAKEVELAYKAGMLHFNALDHTGLDESFVELCIEERRIDSKRPWHLMKGWDPTGPVKQDLLVSLYLQEKGFK